MEKKDRLKKLIKNIKDKDLLYFFMGSAISADTLLSNEACEKSKELLQLIIETTPELDLSEEERNKIIDYCNRGIDICDNEINNFKNE